MSAATEDFLLKTLFEARARSRAMRETTQVTIAPEEIACARERAKVDPGFVNVVKEHFPALANLLLGEQNEAVSVDEKC